MKTLIVGMSHIESLHRGWDSLSRPDAGEVEFLSLRQFLRSKRGGPAEGESDGKGRYDSEALAAGYAAAVRGKDAVLFLVQGNQHNIIGLTEIEPLPNAIEIVGRQVRNGLRTWLGQLLPGAPARVALLLAPPPVESEAHIRERVGTFKARLEQAPLRNAADRLAIWKHQCDTVQATARELGVPVLPLPPSVFSPTGFMAEDCRGNDATHGNATYGARVVTAALAALESIAPRKVPHPYTDLPDYAYWKQGLGVVPREEVDPVVNPRFRIGARDKVATAGSCFAQHISRRLRESGFNFLVTEQAPADQDAAQARGFYDFSARYGNVYTARQLLQLFDRAFGFYQPLERAWKRDDGRWCDPFRPRVEPDGFATEAELEADRERHLAAVRRMFLELDIFVFTLGLTECWISRLDGAAFPMAPGVAGGTYDPDRHAFVNFTAGEVKADVEAFLARLAQVNPRAKVLLTVSPVPLAATREDRHVLVSSTYSKAALRVAAEEVVAAHPHVQYFPSFEIITGPHAVGGYFAADRRSVTERGVDHVMRVFMARMTASGAAAAATGAVADDDSAYAEMEAAAEAACDEELYAK